MQEQKQILEDLLLRIASCKEQNLQDKHLAFTQLYKRTSHNVVSLIFNLLKDRQAASDLTQETYITIWQKAESFDPSKGRAYSWITTIARNKALDYIRKHSKIRLEDGELPQMADPAKSPEENTLNTDYSHVLSAEISRMSPTMAEAIRLFYFEDLSAKEISKQMNKPVNTVKSWLRRGIGVLRERTKLDR